MTKIHLINWTCLLVAALACTACKGRAASEEPVQRADISTPVAEPVAAVAESASAPIETPPEAVQEDNSTHCLKTRECAEDEYCQLKTQTCEKKCTRHEECGEERICRSDGRCSSKYFETVWEITAPNQTITLPFYPRNNTTTCGRDFSITWGDGTAKERYYRGNDRDKITHTYRKPGIYHIKIDGFYYGWGRNIFGDDANRELLPLIEVVSFGNVGLTTGAFSNTQLQKIPEWDVPNAHSLTTLCDFFNYAEEFNQPIYWDTAHVTSMSDMFYNAKTYNQPILFDTSAVTNMSGVFTDAVSFNAPVQIDTSSVKLMVGMFQGAEAFNQPVPFDTHNVIDFESMFLKAKSFNQPVNFDTSNALTLMDMFYKAESFNQPITFNVPKVQRLCNMFAHATHLNSPLEFINNPLDNILFDGMMYGTDAFQSTIKISLNDRNKEDFQETIHSKVDSSHYDLFNGTTDISYEALVYPKPHSDKPSIRPVVIPQKIGHYDADHVCQSQEGCSCGNGYCGYHGKCVKNMCECGGFDEIDNRYYSIKSNQFKEFTCEVWPEDNYDIPREVINQYHWICKKEEGCRYRSWIYPYRSRRGVSTIPYDPNVFFSDYELIYGVYDRILTPELEKKAQELEVVYHKSQASDNRCVVTELGTERNWMMYSECRKVKPEYLCEEEYCTCGNNVCERGYACSDTYECLCSNPGGCKCGIYYVAWGMGCYDRVPYCGKKPRPNLSDKNTDWRCEQPFASRELEWNNY